MNIVQNFRLFAAYNQWANSLIFESAGKLSSDAYKRDVSAYFKSMHGTLNHVLVADRIWMKRFTGTGEHPASLDAILTDDSETLNELRKNEDQRIINWVNTLDEEQLGGSFTFTPMTSPYPVTQKVAPCLSHFFNHQTHHRGHAHMILSVLGENPPSMDMVYFLRLPVAKDWQ